MGILGKIFGIKKRQPYVAAGTALTLGLPRSLNLPDWHDGLPNYTPEEVAAIDANFSQFQYLANSQLNGEVKFHPDVIPEIQRKLAGDALFEFAKTKFNVYSDVPTDWQPVASTFLKAWVSRLDPLSLLLLGDLLAKVGRKNEAKDVFQVVLLFPTYSKILWGKDDNKLLGSIVGEAKESLRNLNK